MTRGRGIAFALFGIVLTLAAVLAIALAPSISTDRTRLQPGWDFFTPRQDIQIGKRLAAEVPRQMFLLDNRRVDDYLNQIGKRLAAHAPGYRYPYQFRCVNAAAINAFALPGGYIYIDRGVIASASDESELAGVMAHEIAHVALRHGTSQASKAYLAEIPVALFSGWLGNNSWFGSAVMKMTAGFVLNTAFLKYSREDETQADVLGTKILYESGYDPRALAHFFELIETKSTSQPIEFFSSHPSPEHRIERVMAEVRTLGGPEPGYREDSGEFHQIQKYVGKLPAAPKHRKPEPQ